MKEYIYTRHYTKNEADLIKLLLDDLGIEYEERILISKNAGKLNRSLTYKCDSRTQRILHDYILKERGIL